MRTVPAIKNEMTAAFMADPNIKAKYDPDDTWTTTTLFDDVFAKASVESIIFYIVAIACWGLEFLFGKHLEEVAGYEEKMRVGTKEWWRQLCYKFQLGYSLTFDSATNTFQYSEIDESAKIIKYVDIRETTSGLVILINQADGNGNPVKLDTVDLTVRNAFDAYIKKTKVAGVPLSWNSYAGDLVKITLNVVYDPLVLNASGELITTGENPIDAAVSAYLKDIPFGSGVMNKTDIIDAIQEATGVIDVYPASTSWLEVSSEYIPAFTVVNGQNSVAYGGSFKLDTITINYLSNV